MSKRTTIKLGYKSNPRSDSDLFPVAQTTALTKTTRAVAIYPYGFSGHEPNNCAAIIMEVMDESNHLVGHFYDPKTRFKNLKEGEVQVGNQLKESSIKFDENGDIIITCRNIIINAQTVTINGNLRVSGNITDNYNSNSQTLKQLRDKYSLHTHTSAAVGVQTSGPNDPPPP
jgi:phage gp45-like